MADAQRRSSSAENHRPPPTRLQRRAPASLEVNPPSSFASDWKVAIPLLSPLALSPSSPNHKLRDRTVEVKSREEPSRPETERLSSKTWQHPASPFYYKSAPPFVPSFVPHCR